MILSLKCWGYNLKKLCKYDEVDRKIVNGKNTSFSKTDKYTQFVCIDLLKYKYDMNNKIIFYFNRKFYLAEILQTQKLHYMVNEIFELNIDGHIVKYLDEYRKILKTRCISL